MRDLNFEKKENEYKRYLDNLAPIVLFTYKRLQHTQMTIEALKKNIYADKSILYIFSDAPKSEQDKNDVREVREYIKGISGFKKIKIIERQENWGLARNIIDGVTRIVSEYGKIIVLEDDIVTSKWFLKFMNDALYLYEDDNIVMEINGYNVPLDSINLPQSYFLEFADCWGWGTWARAWNFFSREPEKIRDSFSDEEIIKFNFDGKCPSFWKQIIENCDGKIYTWAIFWQVAIFKNNGISLIPRESLVCNIGMDFSGEHCSNTEVYGKKVRMNPISEFPTNLIENKKARVITAMFYEKNS